jgi:hypothetical protein
MFLQARCKASIIPRKRANAGNNRRSDSNEVEAGDLAVAVSGAGDKMKNLFCFGPARDTSATTLTRSRTSAAPARRCSRSSRLR